MPWTETNPMSERGKFIKDWQRGHFTVTDLAQRYGVSRKTAYKWIGRYDGGGRPALVDRSHAPNTCPHKISDGMARRIVNARKRYPSWGPAKLLSWISTRNPKLELPATSTVGDLLRREGLVKPRRRRRSWKHPGAPMIKTEAPNDVWTADFKGQFPTRNGTLCYPLTIADQHSRYLLACHALTSTRNTGVRPVFERLFREVGLPEAILTDNGVPFASTGIHGLSVLNVWWIQLGIGHKRIEPGHPEQNGAHERMHRTLKAETARPPATTLRGQQRKFTSFRKEYNEERPHMALGQGTPAKAWRPSRRPYPRAIPEPEYPGHHLVRLVCTAGTFRFRSRAVFLSHTLQGLHIGLEEIRDGIWAIYVYDVRLGTLDERDFRVYP